MNSKDSGNKSPFPEASLPRGVTQQTWGGQPSISETPGLMKTDHVGPSDSLRFSGWMFLLLWVFMGFGEKALDSDLNMRISTPELDMPGL